jgi:hypothetical protein
MRRPKISWSIGLCLLMPSEERGLTSSLPDVTPRPGGSYTSSRSREGLSGLDPSVLCGEGRPPNRWTVFNSNSHKSQMLGISSSWTRPRRSRWCYKSGDPLLVWFTSPCFYLGKMFGLKLISTFGTLPKHAPRALPTTAGANTRIPSGKGLYSEMAKRYAQCAEDRPPAAAHQTNLSSNEP